MYTVGLDAAVEAGQSFGFRWGWSYCRTAEVREEDRGWSGNRTCSPPVVCLPDHSPEQ